MYIGIDLIKIERIEKMRERFGHKGLQRFMLPSEIETFKRSESIAGVWAAKEAIAKALGCGIGKDLAFHDILLSKDERGAPKAILLNNKDQVFGIKKIALSISHDGEYAVCAVLIV
ncbi:holo-ACP synthase [Nitratiruptor sp. YY09-18]|uniref:holo-ACP synthase n=1 Tax=Nitratiruptor sp. YY09-18 TaxID=2724901 RepID=UPI001915D389|nr:holo-ACP synthase [Nitratiruptor sp. YY09-18]BCD68262.1 holo-[acyl-carrier protein] synthase [Nitratiruptor sp. YY09-18]